MGRAIVEGVVDEETGYRFGGCFFGVSLCVL
jgi:hypothetical protein